VGLELFLFPKPGSGYGPMTAQVEVVRGKDRRWRVSYWMPEKFHAPIAASTKKAKKAKAKATNLRKRHKHKVKQNGRAAAAQVDEGPRARGAWWAIPVALLSLAVVAPIVIGLIVLYRNRKARREYLRSAG
jgi:hypothetical protein